MQDKPGTFATEVTENTEGTEKHKLKKKLFSVNLPPVPDTVIPAKAGIQEFQKVTNRLDTRFAPSLGLLRTSRGYDDFLRVHQN